MSNKGDGDADLLGDFGESNKNSKGHTWDKWDDDWEKVDGQQKQNMKYWQQQQQQCVQC